MNAKMYHAPMRYAIFNGDNARLQALLNKGALPNGPNAGEEELLYLAVGRRNPAAVRSLLKRGADARGHHGGRSMLEQALLSREAEIEIVRMLLDHGADPNQTVRTTSERSDLGNASEPRMMLTHAPMPPVMPVVVTGAVGARNPEILKLVLDRGARVTGELGDGPLVTAINGNKGDAIRLLVARGANPNARLNEVPILSYACGISREEAALALMEMKADVNAADPAGVTPLMKAAARARDPELVRQLLRHGAWPEVRDRAGLNALAHAEQELKLRTERVEDGLKQLAKREKITPERRARLRQHSALDERREIIRLLRNVEKK